MEVKYVAFESSKNDEHEAINGHINISSNNDLGWQKVSYGKRQKKQSKPSTSDFGKIVANGSVAGGDNVFQSLEKQAEDRRRRILEAKRLASVDDDIFPVKSKLRSDDEDADDSGAEVAVENGKAAEIKKVKPKKHKKPKISVAEAAAKIDVDDLSVFLAEALASFETQQDIQLMRFADYFARAFSAVVASQFPWMKIFRESTVAKLVDIPLSHISDAVQKTSAEWLNKHSIETLSSFLLWSLDSILADLTSQQVIAKGSKKGVQQQASSKSQVAIFVVVALILRRKPDVLISLLPTLRENSKYQGHDKLPVIVWMAVQASQRELAVGLHAWAHNLVPIVGGKSCNPQSRDLILQLIERILSTPKARTILVNGAIRKGERLIPPSAFEILMRVSFPAASARVKATERFEAIYPTLKVIALAGPSGSKAMKQATQQIFNFAARAAGESATELSNEATGVLIWCLSQNVDCYKQWDKIYEDNLEASVAVLKKLSEEWKEQSAKLSPPDTLRDTLNNFRLKNEKALSSEEEDANHQAIFKEADKYTKWLLGRLSRGHGCLKGLLVSIVLLGIGAALIPPNLDSLEWEKLSAIFISP